MPGIEADDHFPAGQTMINKVVGESGGGLPDDDSIHAIRSSAERAAESSRAELESGGECVDKFGHCAGVPGIRRLR